MAGMTAFPPPPPDAVQWSANHLMPADRANSFGRTLAANPLLHLTGGAGYVADGGKLSLENGHLVFRPHAVNAHPDPFAIPLGMVRDVQPFRKSITVGIVVHLHNGDAARFVVWGNKKVANTIRAAIGLPPL